MNKKSRTRLLIATGVIVVASVVGVIFLIQQQGAYYGQVADLASGRYDGKNVKVAGRVVDGTIERDEAGLHFIIQDLTGKTDTVKVTYSGQTPGAFAEGVDVVIVGKYAAADGVVSADELQTKCPSKYEGKASPAAQSGQ